MWRDHAIYIAIDNRMQHDNTNNRRKSIFSRIFYIYFSSKPNSKPSRNKKRLEMKYLKKTRKNTFVYPLFFKMNQYSQKRITTFVDCVCIVFVYLDIYGDFYT